jgi:nitroimidazol reductase NimA-like FMN-containing flavoprotein (pyridoxamine 5'-phosphate oxidase superfamily)
MERTKKEIEKEILEFLDEHSSKKRDLSKPAGANYGIPCALGTCRDNIPRVTLIDFYNVGLTLWMVGDPGGKIADMRSNPNVSIAIYGRVADRTKGHKSLRLLGKASLVTYAEQEQLYLETITQFGLLDSFKKLVQSDLIEKIPFFESVRNEDVETRLNKVLNTETMIKVEPEKIILSISKPGDIGEQLVWEKEG